jgi:hypothetical protein
MSSLPFWSAVLKSEHSGFPTALSASLKTATELSKAMIQNLVSQAQKSLHEQIVKTLDLSLRNKGEDALVLLEKTRVIWFEQFPSIVEQTLAERAAEPANSLSSERKRVDTPLSLDALELMDDSQVQLRVQSARMQQATILVCERELADLDALVSAVLGLSSVEPSQNPFKPQSFIDALNDVIDQTPANAAIKTLWSNHLGAGLGRELKLIYRQLSSDFSSMGMVAPTYRVVPIAASPRGHARPSLDSSPQIHLAVAPSATVSASDMRVTLDQLRSILAAKAPAEHQQMLMTNPEMGEIAGLLSELEEIKELVGLLAQNTPIGENQPGSEGHDSEVSSEVVRMLVGNLQAHPRLLNPVREWVNSLQKPIQTLSLTDVVFLRDASHPVRQLLDTVINRSLGFTSETNRDFQDFFTPVVVVSQQLHRASEVTAHAFLLALQDIQQLWRQADEQRQKAKEQAVQALLQAEQRNKLAEKIGFELTRRKDAARAPIFVKQFLAGPWAQVIARAQLYPIEAGDLEKFKKLVVDLLWTTDSEVASRDKKRLTRIVPRVLLSLSSGLKTVEYPAPRSDEFLRELMKCHEQILKSTPPTSERKHPKKLTREELDELLDQSEPNMWIAPKEAKDSGFMESGFEDVTATQPMPLHELPGAAPASRTDTDSGLEPLERVALGSWVDLQKDTVWQRAQLTWVSPRGSLFMFTAVDGAPFSMTQRTLHNLLDTEKMRVVASADLVTSALDAVAEAALQNTINLNLIN